jgi:hypothetical protein
MLELVGSCARAIGLALTDLRRRPSKNVNFDSITKWRRWPTGIATGLTDTPRPSNRTRGASGR